MKSFDYVFGVFLRLPVVQHTNKPEQGSAKAWFLSATDAKVCANLTVSNLCGMQSNDRFKLLWAVVLQHQSHIDVLPSKLSRKCRAPARFTEGAEPFHHIAPEAVYWQEILLYLTL